jgi:outer membrane protein assembly factor BamC
VKSILAVTPVRFGVLALASLLAGCSSLDGVLSGEKIDYRGATVKAKALEVPPDLTQLARESRYQTQGGVVTASTAGAPRVAPATGAPTVALAAQGAMRIERLGQHRWLVVPLTPEQLWPQLRPFWEQRGFTIAVEDAKAGLMETNWSENRGKLPADVVRNTIGRVLGNLYDTGERDIFRTRLERTANGTEVYISHRGAEEVYAGERRENTAWRTRATDPQLEAEFLSRLMVALGSKEEPARAALAAVPEQPARARTVAGGAALEIDDPFDRAWRRVGLALDRSGFTVEDRDRAAGLYYVRYVDPKMAGKVEPGWWARLFGDTTNPQAAVRYRIAVKGNVDKSVVAVLTSAGAADVGEVGQRIASVLLTELR